MAKVVKKKKKKLGSGFGGGGVGVAARETTNLRPVFATKIPPCINKCPNNTDIRGIITTIAQTEKAGRTYEESYKKAWEIVTEKNPFPAVCGRVCPHPCEEACNRNELDEPVGINKIERFIGDFGIEQKLTAQKLAEEKHEEKLAVIGSGPAGLSFAYQMARRGYPVTVFEGLPKPGGMLRYGIPAYRLPRDVLDAEIQRILDLGVDLKCNTIIGKDISYDDLKKEYKAIFVGIGAHKGVALNIPGEDSENVYTGVGFLRLLNSGNSVNVGKKVLVIGGGDTAIDAARVSKRLGADVTIVYRRTVKEMPAIDEEIKESEIEGINFEFLSAPLEIIKSNGRATAMKCIRMELKEADSSGRPRPVPIEGSEFTVEADTIISAISQEPDFEGLDHLRSGKDWIKASEKGETEIEKTFAGGDALELGLVTMAIAQGRWAAETVDARLRNTEIPPDNPLPEIKADKMQTNYYEKLPRQEQVHLVIEERFSSLDKEVVATLTEEQVKEEAKRCLSCGQCFFCEQCWMYCQVNAVIKPLEPRDPYKFKMEFCDGCKKCAEVCPCGYIDMV